MVPIGIRGLTIILILSLGQLLNGQNINCSAFVINDNNILLGKNLDWELRNGLVIFNPAGEFKKSVNKNNGRSWKSIYNSITFNHFGKQQPLGGMNKAGLVVEELSTWPAVYPYDDKNPSLTEFEWIQYQLDNYSTVQEVIAGINETNIRKFYFELHFLIADRNGDAAVVEFIDGEAVIYNEDFLPFPALTNNNYDKLIKYRELIIQQDMHKLNISYSQDRFLKILNLLERDIPDPERKDQLWAMNILDSVSVEDTRWSIVYDISNGKIYYKTDLNRKLKTVSFSDFIPGEEKSFFVPITEEHEKAFRELKNEDNEKYLATLRNEIIELSDSNTEELIGRINSLINRIFEE